MTGKCSEILKQIIELYLSVIFLKAFRISSFNKHIRISIEVLAEISAKLAVYYIESTNSFFKKEQLQDCRNK
jgi:hypothetical protein